MSENHCEKNGVTKEVEMKLMTEEGLEEGEEALEEGPKAKYRQYFVAFSAHLGALIMATVWSWSSTALPSLRLDDLGSRITMWEESWIASITFMAGGIGSLFVGLIAQKLGLKMSLVIATVPLLIGWLMVTFANSMFVILAGRFLTGFWVAGVGVSTSLVSEFAKESRRGRLNLGFDLLFCVGVLLIYIIGTFWAWRLQAGVCAGICILFFVLLLLIPESPRCLIQKGKLEEAKEALRWVRDRQNVAEEFNRLNKSVQKEVMAQEAASSGSCLTSLKSFMELDVIKPIILCIALQFFLQVCGVVPIVCYAVDVFKAAGTEGVHENVSTIVLGAVNLVATMVALNFVDKYGRRVLMIVSEIFLVITLTALAIFLYLKNQEDSALREQAMWNWFPLSCFVIFITAYSFGVGPLPWVILGEVLSHKSKGFSNGVVILAARVFGFFVMFFFKDMIEVVGQHGVYFFFAGVCFLGLLFSYFFIPETKGKTLEQIQEDLKGKWFHHRDRSSNSSLIASAN